MPPERPESAPHFRPEPGRPEHARPEHARPEHGRPEHGRPEHGRPGPVRSRRSGAPLVLVAHGSRDPRAEVSTRALVESVVAARPGVAVHGAFLDFVTPTLSSALLGAADPGGRLTVVPLLLTAAYHGRVDVPAEIRKVHEARPSLTVSLADVLGPVAGPADAVATRLLVRALARRLREAVPGFVDGVVLAAAGTRSVPALATVDTVAEALGRDLGVPCRSGYASGAGPSCAAAVAALRAGGAASIAVASYFLAPGLLYDRAVTEAVAAGAVGAAAPLGHAPEISDLVLFRADRAAISRSLADV